MTHTCSVNCFVEKQISYKWTLKFLQVCRAKISNLSSNYKCKCPYRAKDFRMYPIFSASYPFDKGENKDFWLLSIKLVEGKLPASTITTSLNTFPLNPSLNTFFSAQLRSSQHSGTDSFLFSKREQKLLWEKKTKSHNLSKYRAQMTVCPVLPSE